jgi:integrase
LPTCEEYVGLYIADFAHGHKQSSVDAQISRLRRFREDFGGRPLDLTRVELKEWMRGEGRWAGRASITYTSMSAVISLYYHAIDESELPLERNPASKLSKRVPRSAEEPPPTQREFEALVAACSTLGSYGKTMRALLLFGAYTLMRPSELCALEWRDIDFAAMRIHKRRRLYRAELDVPKTGPKLIALTAPAREAIKRVPRDSDLVFTSKTGLRLSTRNLGSYWRKVLEAAGLKFDFYHATKHYGVHYMWTQMGLSPRAVAAQAGWKLETANKMLAAYGHGEFGALEEIDQAFEPGTRFAGQKTWPRRGSAGRLGTSAHPGFPRRLAVSPPAFPGRDVGFRLANWGSPRARPGNSAHVSPGDKLGAGEAPGLVLADVGAENDRDHRRQDLRQTLGFADEEALVEQPRYGAGDRDLERLG